MVRKTSGNEELSEYQEKKNQEIWLSLITEVLAFAKTKVNWL